MASILRSLIIKSPLRIVPNALIKLTNVKVDEADRLQNITSFKDIPKILYSTRAGVAYMATGGMAGALRATLRMSLSVSNSANQLVNIS